jgi:hypothetical protein
MSQNLISELARIFAPDVPLKPGDKRYVECSVERGSDEMLNHMANTIYRSEGNNCLLLSGHRGCGKTTELFRLQQMILRSSAYFVAYCEADSYVDPSDVEYTDVLLAIIQQLALDAKHLGIQIEPGRIRSIIDDLWGLLSAPPVQPKEVEFSVGIAKLVLAVKKDGHYRQLVRNQLRFHTLSFLGAVNEVVEIATEAFKRLGYKGIVIIVDNLDRIVRNVDPITGRTNHDSLFIDTSDHLRDLACNVIYTVPPALLYSYSGANLHDLYNSTVEIVPMIPVATRNRDYTAEGLRVVDEAGLSKLVEVIHKRLEYINTTPAVAFDSENTIIRLCKVSGGHVRILMTLVRSAAFYVKDLPITIEAVERAIRGEREQYVRSISSPQQWQVLREIAEGKDVEQNEDFLRLLQNFTILEYRDKEEPWYDVNPVVRESRKFVS